MKPIRWMCVVAVVILLGVVRVSLRTADTVIGPVSQILDLPESGGSRISLGDLDGDGDLDALVTGGRNSPNVVLLNDPLPAE